MDKIIAAARQFALEWAELRALYRVRLFNTPLLPVLDKYIDALTTKALESGAYGLGLQRNVTVTGTLPQGARLRQVSVRIKRTGAIVSYE